MTVPRTYPFGVTSWIDVEVDDVEATKAFYGDLFGWTFERGPPPDSPSAYVIARLDGLDVAGLTGPSEAVGDAGGARWRTYVAVDDLQATAAAVTQAGGELIGEPLTAGEAGRWVDVLDPDGVELSLWQAG